MLSYDILKNHSGIILIGDYLSLRSLHEIIHDINERSPLIKDLEGPFLAFAYDIRKAYEGQREILFPPEHSPEIGQRYGVKLLWPPLLLQHRMLRVSLAYLPHTANHQAVVYALESIIEEALVEDFGNSSQEIIWQWKCLHPEDVDFFEKLHSRGGLFCSWKKTARKKHFADLLSSFHPMYEAIYNIRSAEYPQFLTPEKFLRWADVEWPDPNW